MGQFIYLVMFSYPFFLKGFTGLAITTGSVVTLFVVMQVTGRIRWADRFSLKPPEEPAGNLKAEPGAIATALLGNYLPVIDLNVNKPHICTLTFWGLSP